MLTKNFLFKFAAMLFVALMLVGLPASSFAAGNDIWQPKLPPVGIGSVVWTNHVGLGGVLSVDLDGTLYKVTEKSNDIPGRLQLNLTPGTYTYTASYPAAGSASRTIEVVAGKITELSFVNEQVISARCFEPDRADDTCKPGWKVIVSQADITNQAQ